jgi:ubiquinone/menaquinone biosynthesis C-methylase UbiE
MAEFHFVEDYRRHIANLVANYPIDEAMSLAVGGDYHRVGKVAVDLLEHLGLEEGMTVLDFGCGSGRVATVMAREWRLKGYVGIDVVQQVLDYADSKTPKEFEFICNSDLSIPQPDNKFDLVFAFSVFTHLLHAESFIYLREMARVTRPQGRIIFSFLEFEMASHWAMFEATVDQVMQSKAPVLNMFIERNQIAVWAEKLGLEPLDYVDGHRSISEHGALGQSCVLLQKAN